MLIALFLIILVTFVIMHAVPGGPFTSDRNLSEEVEAALNAKYHLDDLLPKQFFDYLKGFFREISALLTNSPGRRSMILLPMGSRCQGSLEGLRSSS